jgi:hypothetical protein
MLSRLYLHLKQRNEWVFLCVFCVDKSKRWGRFVGGCGTKFWWTVLQSRSSLKIAVFWDVAPCRSCVNRRFGETYRHLSHWFLARGFFYTEDGGDTFLRNVGWHKLYTESQSKNGILHSHRCENLKSYRSSSISSDTSNTQNVQMPHKAMYTYVEFFSLAKFLHIS